MEEFLKDVSNISWWLGVVVVGIVVNVASHYVTRRFDTQLSRAFSWWRKISGARKQKRLRAIEKIRASANARMDAKFLEIWLHVHGWGWFVVGIMSTLAFLYSEHLPNVAVSYTSGEVTFQISHLVVIFLGLMIVMSFFFCLDYFLRGKELQSLVREAAGAEERFEEKDI